MWLQARRRLSLVHDVHQMRTSKPHFIFESEPFNFRIRTDPAKCAAVNENEFPRKKAKFSCRIMDQF